MHATLLSEVELSNLFRFEYDRINADVYDGRLGPFPGVRVGRGVRQYGCCLSKRGSDGGWRVERFHITRYLARPEDVLDTIWHEIAHAAAIGLHGHSGHGRIWAQHARRLGARVAAVRQLQTTSPAPTPFAVVRCAGSCGWSREYHRRGKVLSHPRDYRCGRCRAGIVVDWPRA